MADNTDPQDVSRFRAAELLYQKAQQQAPDERESFIREATDDPLLVDQVLELLAACSEDAPNIDAIVAQAVDDAAEVLGREPIKRIGPYEVISELGQGGMGRVYLARRADNQFRQRVAIKLLASRLPNQHLLQRFRTERQILANLNHPNVARLLDGGETEDGLPYLVMEYVDGIPILEYCDANRLGISERLRLLIHICDAVQHAHQNLVIHRDIKSTNILVTTSGQPKLLDFGIAKLLHPEGSAQPIAHTVADARVLTPANASPEQVRGEHITAATDVYSLGLLLYELLTGEAAYTADNLNPTDLAHAICEVTPDRPSERVTQITGTDFGGRASTTGRLSKTLHGDLDTIVLSALRKEPDRRYPTVRLFADDLRSFLEHRPVSARPDSFHYRAGKFVRRQRILLTAVALVLIIGGASIWQIVVQRDRASAAAKDAETVARFLVETIKQADPDATKGKELTAKEALDRGARQLELDTNVAPGTRALISQTIGEVYHNLGSYEEAARYLSDSVELYRSVADERGQIVSLRLLGSTHYALGHIDEAKAVLNEALTMSESLFASDDIEVAESARRLANIVGGESDYEGAITLFERAIGIYERTGQTGHPLYLATLYGLGEAKMIQGKFDESESVLRQALEGAERQFGDYNTSTIDYMKALAITLHEAGDLEGAEPYYLRSNELEIAVLGEDHPSREYTLTSIGRLYRHMDRTEEAEQYLRAAVDAAKRGLGEWHTYTAYDSINLANFLGRQKRYDEAEPLFRSALDIYAQSLPEQHLYVASANIGFANLLVLTGRPAEARQHAEKAVKICNAILPANHTITGNALLVLGKSLLGVGDSEAAEPLMLEGYEIIRTATPNDPVIPIALASLIELYERRGNSDKVAFFQAALDELEAP